MAVVAARIRPGSSAFRTTAGSEFCIDLGLVNNMPDAALARTERQLFNLLGAVAPDLLVRVSFYSLPTIARDHAGLDHLQTNSYRNVAELPGANLDAIIVTGTEPRHRDLKSEPYWSELAQLFDWVAKEGRFALYSCLAAHAAVLHYDGIERQRLRGKCFGLFPHAVAAHDRLTESLASPLMVAHSRWNEVSALTLAACGYKILTWAPEAGVDLFLKRGRRNLLFCQGHPEYGPSALGSEYRRDVRRFLAHECAAYPSLPQNYFEAAEVALLTRFRERALAERCETLMAQFPAIGRGTDARWQPPGACVFRAWLRQIVELKRQPRSRPLI